jgi:hypothetical protein
MEYYVCMYVDQKPSSHPPNTNLFPLTMVL